MRAQWINLTVITIILKCLDKNRSYWLCSVTSVMSNSVILWTLASQAPPSMEFSRQEDWSGLPCPPPEDLSDPGIKPIFLTSVWAGRFFTTSAIWEALYIQYVSVNPKLLIYSFSIIIQSTLSSIASFVNVTWSWWEHLWWVRF